MALSSTPNGYLPSRHPKRLAARLYNVDRLYFNRPGVRRRILSGVSLETAQAHCSDLNASSKTAWTTSGLKTTRRFGPRFDSYSEAK